MVVEGEEEEDQVSFGQLLVDSPMMNNMDDPRLTTK